MNSRNCTRPKIRKRLNKAIPLRKEAQSGKSLPIYKDGHWMVLNVNTASELSEEKANKALDTKSQSH